MDSAHKRQLKALALEHMAALLAAHEPDTADYRKLDKTERAYFKKMVAKTGERMSRSAIRHRV